MSRRVALVLSGGGAKAAYEAGALLPIVRKAGRVDIVSGVSTGAINAAVLACTFEQTGNWAKSALAVRRVWAEIGPLFRFELGSVFRKMIGSIVTSDGPFSLKSFFNFPSLVDVAAVRQKVDDPGRSEPAPRARATSPIMPDPTSGSASRARTNVGSRIPAQNRHQAANLGLKPTPNAKSRAQIGVGRRKECRSPHQGSNKIDFAS